MAKSKAKKRKQNRSQRASIREVAPFHGRYVLYNGKICAAEARMHKGKARLLLTSGIVDRWGVESWVVDISMVEPYEVLHADVMARLKHEELPPLCKGYPAYKPLREKILWVQGLQLSFMGED